MAQRATVRTSAGWARRVGVVAGLSVLALALSVPVGSGPADLAGRAQPAGAAPAPDADGAQARVEAARRETEAVADRYFAQLDRYEVLGSEIAATEQRMTDIRGQADGLRDVVARRARRAYKSGGAGSVDFMLDGRDISDIARGTKLLSVANARDDAAVAQLGRLSEDLQSRRVELEAGRREQASALESLRTAQRRVDGNLRAALADQQTVVTRLAAQAAADRAARQAAASASTQGTSPTNGRTSAPSSAPRSRRHPS